MSGEPAQRPPLVLVSNRGPVTFHAGGEVQRGSGWTPHRYAAFAGEACVGLASVVTGRIPGLPCSVLDACRGPLLDWDDDGVWRGFLPAIRRLAERERAILLRISPSISRNSSGPSAGIIEARPSNCSLLSLAEARIRAASV